VAEPIIEVFSDPITSESSIELPKEPEVEKPALMPGGSVCGERITVKAVDFLHVNPMEDSGKGVTKFSTHDTERLTKKNFYFDIDKVVNIQWMTKQKKKLDGMKVTYESGKQVDFGFASDNSWKISSTLDSKIAKIHRFGEPGCFAQGFRMFDSKDQITAEMGWQETGFKEFIVHGRIIGIQGSVD